MEGLFEIKQTITEKNHKEICRNAFFRRPAMYVLYAIYGFLIFCELCDLFIGNDVDWFLIGVILFVGGMLIFSYIRALKSSIAQNIELHGSAEKEGVFTITDDTINYYSSILGDKQFDVYNIKKVTQNKNYIFMCSKSKLRYIIKKDSFTKGSATELLRFFESKGIKVKGFAKLKFAIFFVIIALFAALVLGFKTSKMVYMRENAYGARFDMWYTLDNNGKLLTFEASNEAYRDEGENMIICSEYFEERMPLNDYEGCEVIADHENGKYYLCVDYSKADEEVFELLDISKGEKTFSKDVAEKYGCLDKYRVWFGCVDFYAGRTND